MISVCWSHGTPKSTCSSGWATVGAIALRVSYSVEVSPE